MPSKVLIVKSESEVYVRTPRSQLPTILSGLGGFFIGLVMVFADGVAVKVTGVVVALCFAAIYWNARRAALVLTRETLTERGDLRNHRVDTKHLVRFRVDRSHHVVPWNCIWVELDTGAALALEQVRVLRGFGNSGTEQLESAAMTLNRWLEPQ